MKKEYKIKIKNAPQSGDTRWADKSGAFHILLEPVSHPVQRPVPAHRIAPKTSPNMRP